MLENRDVQLILFTTNDSGGSSSCLNVKISSRVAVFGHFSATSKLIRMLKTNFDRVTSTQYSSTTLTSRNVTAEVLK